MLQKLHSVRKALTVTLALIVVETAETAPVSAGRIQGEVLHLEGNFMPTTNPEGPAGTTVPLSVPVYIFKGKIRFGKGLEFESPRLDDPRIAKIVHTDAKGKYETDLPSGTYTVFALIHGRLYLNDFDGIEHYTSLRVKPGQEARHDIRDTRQATF